MRTVNQLLGEHFRCPDADVDFEGPRVDKAGSGYFLFGKDIVCYGQANTSRVARTLEEPLPDLYADTRFEPDRCLLPFDGVNTVENLRRERYRSDELSGSLGKGFHGLGHGLYYLLRPWLATSVRSHLQKWILTPRLKTKFPRWPVDRTADHLLEQLLAMYIKAQGLQKVPFIWFWPDGHSSAAIVTHDVETTSGVQFCSNLMDMDEAHGIPASFQIVPEDRYSVPDSLLKELRQRRFEINLHDLNHDGCLYRSHDEFSHRAKKINQYCRDFRTRGFRSGALYRNLDWYSAFEFAYDMSVPNVAHLEPQRGGCCTVMPFFVGNILELPVTTIQDYSLFNVLRDHSIELWKSQIQIIQDGYGLISIIAHPDYLRGSREQETYVDLLNYLARLRSDTGLWITLPAEINDWWRERSRLQLISENGTWRIEGPGRERARIAYAHLTSNGVHFELPEREFRSTHASRTRLRENVVPISEVHGTSQRYLVKP